jgi:hypothetical protein
MLIIILVSKNRKLFVPEKYFIYDIFTCLKSKHDGREHMIDHHIDTKVLYLIIIARINM